MRSSSDPTAPPQAGLLRTTSASAATPRHTTTTNTAAGLAITSSSRPGSPRPTALAANGSRAPPAAATAAAVGAVSGDGDGGGAAAVSSNAVAASATSSSAALLSFGSTWGLLRRLLPSSRPLEAAPNSGTLATGASSSSGELALTQQGMHAAAHSTSADAMQLVTTTVPNTTFVHAAAGAASAPHREQGLLLGPYRPPLQLIQESAPLSSSALLPGLALSQQQLQLMAATGGLCPQSGRLYAEGGVGVGGVVGVGAVSRRISPIESVHEDNSSATSTDSLTPAAWQLSDRQLLEDTPVSYPPKHGQACWANTCTSSVRVCVPQSVCKRHVYSTALEEGRFLAEGGQNDVAVMHMLLQGWLNIDFAQEVRLEKKLGEGGFGQVSEGLYAQAHTQCVIELVTAQWLC